MKLHEITEPPRPRPFVSAVDEKLAAVRHRRAQLGRSRLTWGSLCLLNGDDLGTVVQRDGRSWRS